MLKYIRFMRGFLTVAAAVVLIGNNVEQSIFPNAPITNDVEAADTELLSHGPEIAAVSQAPLVFNDIRGDAEECGIINVSTAR